MSLRPVRPVSASGPPTHEAAAGIEDDFHPIIGRHPFEGRQNDLGKDISLDFLDVYPRLVLDRQQDLSHPHRFVILILYDHHGFCRRGRCHVPPRSYGPRSAGW